MDNSVVDIDSVHHSSTDDLVPRDHENEGNCFTNLIRQNRCVQVRSVSVYMIDDCCYSAGYTGIEFEMARAKTRNGKMQTLRSKQRKTYFQFHFDCSVLNLK